MYFNTNTMNKPELYAKYANIIASINESILDQYLENVKFKKEHVSVLDLGSGEGYSTVNVLRPRLPENIRELVGVDLTWEMTQYARSHYCDAPEVTFEQLDITTKRLPEKFCERFDHAFTFFCLHWILDKRDAYENLYKMLTPNGDLLGVYIISSPMCQTYVKLSKYPQWKTKFTKEFIACYEYLGNEETVTENMLRETGFVEYFCRREKKSVTWDSLSEFAQFLVSIDPIISDLNEKERQRYLKDLLDEISVAEDITFKPDGGPVRLKYDLLVLYASKV